MVEWWKDMDMYGNIVYWDIYGDGMGMGWKCGAGRRTITIK